MEAPLRVGAVVKLYERYGIRLDPNSGFDSPRINGIVDTITACSAIVPGITPWNWSGWGSWSRPWGIPLNPFGLGSFGLPFLGTPKPAAPAPPAAAPAPSGAIMDSITPMTAWVIGAAVGGVTTYVAVKKLNEKRKK